MMAGLGTLSSRSSLSECATYQSPLIPDLNSLVGYSSTIKCYKFGFLACVYPFVHSAFKERWMGKWHSR